MSSECDDRHPRARERRLFVISDGHEEWTRILTSAGWRLEFDCQTLWSGGNMPGCRMLVDCRGSALRALREIHRMHSAVLADRGFLLVIIARDDVERLPEFLAAGATHFLVEPASDREVLHALEYADRSTLEERRNPSRGAASIGEKGVDRIRRWLAGCSARGKQCGVIRIALSRLDLVNAAHGRPAVDVVIEQIKERIVVAVGARFAESTDIVRITGSDLMIATCGDQKKMTGLAHTIHTALARPFVINRESVLIGCRLGYASLADDGDPATLPDRANDALSQVKQGEPAILHDSGSSHVASLDRLAVDLHHAIANREIGILFQPQVDMGSGRIVGVEALARWEHPEYGSIGADTLFQAAERADLGLALSDHIQELALERAICWPATLSALRLSLNLTAFDIVREDFASTMLARIARSGFPRGRLTLELTETGLVKNLTAAGALLGELRKAGCRVAIDDFGTGYSSLAYLQALPLDYLKVDRALIRDIAVSDRDRIIIGGVITMARSLGLSVIAEGVETDAQLGQLTAMGCEYYQGFLCSPPVDEARLLDLVN